MTVRISFRDTVPSTEETGNTVIVTTDIPSHLWLRWTTIPPRIHKKPVLRRGMWLNDDVRFCFDVYNDLEQQEEGDTLIHTFVMSPCVSFRQFWYYLWGYVSGELSPSTSSIHEYPPSLECPPYSVISIDAQENNRTLYRSWGTWPVAWGSSWGYIYTYYLPPHLRLEPRSAYTVSFWVQRAFLRFDTTAIPVGSTINYALLALYVKGFNRGAEAPWLNMSATLGVQHTPIVTTDFGDQLPITDIGGLLSMGDLVIGELTVLNLNSIGKAFVIPGGYSQFCIRAEYDVLGIPPTTNLPLLQFGSAQSVYWQRPKLVVRYMPP